MYKKILYKKAYRILENVTPLNYDCGLLCDSKCCSGGEDSGMHLFPGEECMIDKYPGFLKIRNETFEERVVGFAVCNGKCHRSFRPLSCRIFPLIPYMDESGKIEIISDPRARYMCPLLMNIESLKTSRQFAVKVRDVFRLLIQDEDIKSYLQALSRVLDEYIRF